MYDQLNPDVVVLTVGANDVRFGKWVVDCYYPQSACSTPANTLTLGLSLASQRAQLRTTLAELSTRAQMAGKKVRVILTNYFNPFPSQGIECIDTHQWRAIGITNSERAWLVAGLTKLNRNISEEVGYAQRYSSLSVSLADLSSTVRGHEFCSKDPWVYGPSIRYPGFEGRLSNEYPATFHPTPAGQEAIRRVIGRSLTASS